MTQPEPLNRHGKFEQRFQAERTTTGLLQCSYCGSITLKAFLQALSDGATPELADRKYGYLHKIYLRQVPVKEHWRQHTTYPDEVLKSDETGRPTEKIVKALHKQYRTADVKFYTEHVKDGSPEDQKAFYTWLNAYVAARMPTPTSEQAAEKN